MIPRRIYVPVFYIDAVQMQGAPLSVASLTLKAAMELVQQRADSYRRSRGTKPRKLVWRSGKLSKIGTRTWVADFEQVTFEGVKSPGGFYVFETVLAPGAEWIVEAA